VEQELPAGLSEGETTEFVEDDEVHARQSSAHGLRHAAARRLAEAGCTPHEIAAITGHASLKEVVRYTEAADRKHLASAAMDKVKARTLIGKPVVKFAKRAKKAL
jgi:integrase